jgi:predicted nucleic acid binding AN1-type Zn finger protein
MNTFTAPFGDGNTRITAEKDIECGMSYIIYSYKICTDNFCVLKIAKREADRIYEVKPNNLRTFKSSL